MLGEMSLIVSEKIEELNNLREEREMFVMKNEDTLVDFLYKKKLEEYDRRIAECEQAVRDFSEEYDELVADEAREMDTEE